MRNLLHILTRPADELTRRTIELQQGLPEVQVRVLDLSQGEPDYEALVREIFASDSVQVS